MALHEFFLERIDTPTGNVLIVTDDEQRLRAVDWEDHEHRMQTLMRRQYGEGKVKLQEVKKASDASKALLAYFKGDIDALVDLPTATNGTEFQRQVWAALRRIPIGQAISYGALAKDIGKPSAMRAVGLANGSNPIAIVVPCHRVIGANGSLTGFGGGIERKRWLLAHEGFAIDDSKSTQLKMNLQ